MAGIFSIASTAFPWKNVKTGGRRLLASFSKVGLTGKVEFVIVKRHPFDVEQGMYESHMTCLRKGLKAGAERIVVFEDDIVFDRFDAERFKQCTQFLAEHPNWKVLLFGALIRSSRRTLIRSCKKSPTRALRMRMP